MSNSLPAVYLLAVWAYLHTYQHGIHVSVLNGLQQALTCELTGGTVSRGHVSAVPLDSCVPMLVRRVPGHRHALTEQPFQTPQPSQFGFVTAAFTVGGLIGALMADAITRRLGRVRTLQCATTLFASGSLCVGTGNTISHLLLGRRVKIPLPGIHAVMDETDSGSMAGCSQVEVQGYHP